jgi:6-pyruvoyltetrahydropterin/6-carboxytetrahydropterin synthase
MESYLVRVQGDDLTFSASHFITLESGECERLHGHDYRVAAEVQGPPGGSRYVVDFLALKSLLRSILDELDHRVLLAAEHPAMKLAESPQEIEVALGGRRWVLPRGDCALLPLANVTAEMLARLIGRRLQEAAASRLGLVPQALAVELEEGCGQRAIYRWQPDAAGG